MSVVNMICKRLFASHFRRQLSVLHLCLQPFALRRTQRPSASALPHKHQFQPCSRPRFSALHLHKRDGGFTTFGCALAILISITLIFSQLEIYHVNTACAVTQEVADVAALGAAHEVARFVKVARICDSVVLTLSVCGAACAVVGLICLCIPPVSAVGTTLLKAAHKCISISDTFSKKACKVLDSYQDALPFLCTLKVLQTAYANKGGMHRNAYAGLAFLLPSDGKMLSREESSSGTQQIEKLDEYKKPLKEMGEALSKKRRACEQAKLRAFQADCGGSEHPSSMYERAHALGGVPAYRNPQYTSVDAWNFSCALQRAQAYYEARERREHPSSGNPDEQAQSYARLCFYRYMVQQLQQSYIHETDDSFSASLPFIPRNTHQMRTTSLYTDALFPVFKDEDGFDVFCAYPGAPGSNEAYRYGSLEEFEATRAPSSPAGVLRVSDMGKVAAASSAINNGFEFYFTQFINATRDYEKHARDLKPLQQKTKHKLDGAFGEVVKLVKSIKDRRIYPYPPGRDGVCCALINTSSVSLHSLFNSPFIKKDAVIKQRFALSAATLVRDEDATPSFASAMQGFSNRASSLFAGVPLVLNCWLSLVNLYGTGQDMLISGIEHMFDGVPLLNTTGIGRWAAQRFKSLICDLGFDKIDMAPLRAVSVNSRIVLQSATDGVPLVLRRIKETMFINEHDKIRILLDMFGKSSDLFDGSAGGSAPDSAHGGGDASLPGSVGGETFDALRERAKGVIPDGDALIALLSDGLRE